MDKSKNNKKKEKEKWASSVFFSSESCRKHFLFPHGLYIRIFEVLKFPFLSIDSFFFLLQRSSSFLPYLNVF